MRKISAATLAITGCIILAGAAPASAEFDIYGTVAGYNWRETDPSLGTARESGPLYGLGVMARLAPPAPNIFTVTVRAEGFGGNMDYKQTDPGGFLTDRTDVSGVKLEADAGMKLRLPPGLSLEPFAGIGYRWWERNLYYVDQEWQNVYGRVGMRLEQHFPMSPLTVFAEAGARIPLSNRATFEAGGTSFSVNPGKKTSAFAEAGLKVTSLKISAFYEGLRFSASDTQLVATDSLGIDHPFTPEISADIVGVRFGLSFF
jgi:hypothetical protein